MKINRNFIRFFAYTLEIILLSVIQSTPGLLPEIFGGKPLLLAAAAIATASKENQIPSLIFGAVCGILCDTATGGSIGFFAVLLTLICYAESHIFKNYFVESTLSVLAFALIAVSALLCLYFFIFTVAAGIENSGALFVNHYISRIVCTFISVVPLYFLNGFLRKNLYEATTG